ncbi:hypothetical protein F5884DRAFT_261958 [Xylogone sp. PMI_703]|nr:hypothetical protein F5884DRAFT_261958 [Xylogone sp. PMI_703]
MPHQKRRYVPKIKGCHECSQRRIHCDGRRPSCDKCASRMIPCSGFGIRYRFSDDVTSKSKKIKHVDISCHDQQTQLYSHPREIYSDQSSHTSPISNSPCPEDSDSHTSSPGQCNRIPMSVNIDGTHMLGEDTLVEGGLRQPSGSMDGRIVTSNPARSLSLVEPWKEFLLNYYSDRIASEMVVIDGNYNEWRDLILPIAYIDEMVMNAVLAAAASHLSGKTHHSLTNPRKHFAQAVSWLLNRKDLTKCSLQTKQFVFVALIILLLNVMITGCSDFPLIFHMLESALNAVGGEGGLGSGELAGFLLRQIRKLRIYAAPLLSEAEGVYHISSLAHQSFDCLYHHRSMYPNHASTFNMIADIRQQAFDIYLLRVTEGPMSIVSVNNIEHFIETLQSLPDDALGVHVLIWACFMAASESSTQEHQLFFRQYLETQYQRNGFANILKALKLLERIWARETYENWPALLPEPKAFIM